MKPKWQQRCARRCVDKQDRPVFGSQWVHTWGVTEWVCSACATKIARRAGLIPETHISEKFSQARM